MKEDCIITPMHPPVKFHVCSSAMIFCIQYLNGYFQKFGEHDFHPIINRVCKVFFNLLVRGG